MFTPTQILNTNTWKRLFFFLANSQRQWPLLWPEKFGESLKQDRMIHCLKLSRSWFTLLHIFSSKIFQMFRFWSMPSSLHLHHFLCIIFKETSTLSFNFHFIFQHICSTKQRNLVLNVRNPKRKSKRDWHCQTFMLVLVWFSLKKNHVGSFCIS